MAFDKPTYDELLELYLLGLKANLPGVRSGVGSLARLEGVVFSESLRWLFDYFSVIEQNVTPLNANDDGVTFWGGATQLDRKGATGARKANALQVRGTVAASLPIGQALLSRGGLQYQNTSSTVIPASGVSNVDVEAISTGASTRLDAGEPLTFTSPPVGIDQSATLILSLDEGGTDQETIGAWRERILVIWAEKRQGGNLADYEQWALALSFVDNAYVYANKPSPGFVSIGALKDGTGSARELTPAQKTDLEIALQALRPVSDTVVVLDTPATPVHGTVLIVPLPGSTFDFVDPIGGLTVASYDSATRIVTTNETLPSDMSPGHTLTIESQDPDVSGANGQPVQVAAITGGTTFVINPIGIGEPLNFTPVASDPIWAGNKATIESWDAVSEYVNGFGPANPGSIYGDWDSDIRESAISAIVDQVDGVASAVATAVGAVSNRVDAIEFPFPDDDTVELLVAGQWIFKQV